MNGKQPLQPGNESVFHEPENGNFNVGPTRKSYKAKPEGFLSLSEASKITGYHQDYLGQLARGGKLEATKIGRNWVTTQAALDKLIAETTGQAILGGESVKPEVEPMVSLPPATAEALPAETVASTAPLPLEKPKEKLPKSRLRIWPAGGIAIAVLFMGTVLSGLFYFTYSGFSRIDNGFSNLQSAILNKGEIAGVSTYPSQISGPGSSSVSYVQILSAVRNFFKSPIPDDIKQLFVGPAGPEGPTGPTGATGERGPRGSRGATGSSGSGSGSPFTDLTVTGNTLLGDDSSDTITTGPQTQLRFADADSSNYVAFQAPAVVGSNVVWTLPDADSAGCFVSDGSGTVSISACGSGSQTPWTQDVNAAGFNLSGVGTIDTGHGANELFAMDQDVLTTSDVAFNSLTLANTGLHLLDTNASNDLIIKPGSDLTADRTLTVVTGDSDRTVTLSGNLTVSSDATISGTNTGDQTITLTGDVSGSGTGSFSTTIANDAVTYAKIQNVTTNRLLGRATAGSGDTEEISLGSGLSYSGTTLNISGLTDSQISDTLTASIFIGSGSTTNAVDLATAEVAGILPVLNGGTGASTLNNLITLGTHTTGNYVATIADSGSGTIAVTGSGSESAAVTLGIVADSIGDTQLAFNTGQNLTTTSAPTFANITDSGLAGGGTLCLQTDNSGVISAAASACGSSSGIVSLTLAGTSGTPQTLTDGDTITIAAGAGITTTAGATDTVTIASTLGTSVDLTSEVTGILPLANGGTNKNLSVVQGGILWTDSDSVEVSAAGTTGQALISGGTGAPTWYAPTAGSVLFAGSSGILQQDNSNFFWDDTNNRLGIGTNSPEGVLHVVAPNSGNEVALLERDTTDTFNLNTSAALRATSSGNITNGFGSLLVFRIEDNAAVSNDIGYIGSYRNGADNSGELVFAPYSAGSANQALFIEPSGNVGINESNPDALLEIQTNSANDIEEALRIHNPNTGTSAGSAITFFGSSSDNERARIAMQFDAGVSKSDLIFYAGTSGSPEQRLTIRGDGNVGIGTGVPSTLLQLAPIGTSAGNTGELSFLELAANGTNHVGLKAPDSISSNVTWTLPSSDSSGCFQSNGSGTISIASCVSSASFTAAGTSGTPQSISNHCRRHWYFHFRRSH